MTKRTVIGANFLVLAVLIVILLLIGGVTWDRFNAARSARQWTEHSYQVINIIKDLDLAINHAETGQRGFLLTGRDDYLAPYKDAVEHVGLLQGELQQLTADNAVQQKRLRGLLPTIQHKFEILAQTVQLRRDLGMDAAIPIVQADLGRDYMVEIEKVLSAMTSDELALLSERLAILADRGSVVRGLVLGGGAFAILALIYAAYLLNRAWARSYHIESEQRSLALRLRTTLDSLSQGVGVFDADRKLQDWNDCFHELFAVPQAIVRPGMTYAAFVAYTAGGGQTFLESEDQIRHGAAAAGGPITYEHIRSDGCQLELRRTPMPDNGFVLTVTDMTKRAQAESVLREAQKMHAIGHLTGGIAHDFNNLLTAIMGNLELATTRLTDPAALKLRIDQAIWAAQRGATLTSHLLAFARKQTLAPAPIDLSATVAALLPLLHRTLGADIDIRHVENAGLWSAMADAALLENALLNLALNARDAMPGGGRLTIEIANKVLDAEYARNHVEVTPGDYTMLAVSDTGHGMSPDVLARVFEPFYTTKPEGRGTGLGLAMVFGFIKQAGGHVNIYSEPGQGTTVRLYLPRAVGRVTQSAQRGHAPVDLPRGSATVLVVEDDQAVREIAIAILRELGYRVLEAEDGEEGLRLFEQHADALDLLLSDVVLPGALQGGQLAERITTLRPEVRVLFMSGYTENSIVHHGRLDDGVQLIGKPFTREQLARKVADVLSTPLAIGQAAAAPPKPPPDPHSVS
jgi:signal transduction histidine kinase